VRAALARPAVQAALAAFVYLAWAVYVTRPMPFHITSQVFGNGGDDSWSLLAFYREMVQHGVNPFESSRIPDWAAPEGLSIGYAVNLVQWPVVAILYGLTAVFGNVAALNIFVLSSFVLNGTAMFLLARKLTGHAGAAFVAGLAFAFFPRMVIWGQNHQYFAHGWVLVLLSWRMLELSDRPTLRNGLFAGLAAVFALCWNPYYVLFGAVLYAVFVIADLTRVLLRRAPFGPLFKAHAASAAIPLVTFAALAGIARRAADSAGGPVARPISEAYVYSARIHEYLLPDARNPIFGGTTDDFLFKHIHGSGYGEMNLYLGWSVLLLVAVALFTAVRRRWSPLDARHVWTMAGVAVAGLLFSAPPTAQMGAVRLYFPPWLVYQLTSTWRAFARIFPVIAVGVCVLAAYGLARLLAGRRLPVQAVVVAIVAVVVAADLYVTPFVRSTSLPKPQIYEVLKRQPGRGIVAEYPMNPDRIPIYDARLNQDLHGRPVLNGYGDGSDQELRALEVSRLDDPRTAGRLALLGVRWIVVNEGPPPRPDVWAPGAPGRGFRLIDRLEGRSLWAVTARPARSWVPAGAGFYPREGEPGKEWHWMSAADGDLLVHAACGTCSGHVTFEAASFFRPRTLTVRDAGGRVLKRLRVGGAAAPVDVPVEVRGGRAELRLEASPGPQSVRLTTGAPDDRSLAVQIFVPKFQPSAAG
jgi:hypothetical protein